MKSFASSRFNSFSTGGRGPGLKAHASLNLTPMIDMMVIMLIFLIKTYSISPEYLTASQHIELSLTKSEAAAPDAAILMVGREGILLEGKTIVKMTDGKPEASSIDRNGIMPALQTALAAMAAKTQAIAATNEKVKFTGTLILQADKSIPFSQLKPILKTAGLAGYSDFKFAGVYPE